MSATWRWIALAVSAAILLAWLLAWLISKLLAANRIRDASDVETKLAAVSLGKLPLMRQRQRFGLRSSLVYLQANELRFNEAMRQLRTRIVLALIGRPGRLIVVVSDAGRAGCSTVAANLALALGQLERVLLLEADPSAPTVASDFALATHSPGLLNALAANASMQQCVYRHGDAGIDVMPMGELSATSDEVFRAANLARVLAELAPRYDRIVVDAGGVRADRFTFGLAAQADALIYVISAGPVSLRQVRAELQELSEGTTSLLGVVVNRARRAVRKAR